LTYQVDIMTTNLSKRHFVNTFHELKGKITEDFKREVDWNKTVLTLAYVYANVESCVTIIGKTRAYKFNRRIDVKRELNLDTDILDCNCTITGNIVFKRG